MLLAPYHYDNNTFYCRHINDKKLELHDIRVDSHKYFKYANDYHPRKYIICDICYIGLHPTIPTKKHELNSNLYVISEECIQYKCVGARCKMIAGTISNIYKQYLTLGNHYFMTWCQECIKIEWENKSCDDCDKKKSNDLFKTVCQSCLSIKSNELHLCTYHLDYNADIINIIINQLDEIKNYFVGLKN
jgi:hypothetical protein